jgi:ABC-type Fe3+ transport system permease subunit
MDLEQVVAYLIAGGLLILAGYYAWQQRQTLRSLADQTDLTDPDRSYLRRQAWLRLACCALMLVLAVMVAGTYLSGMEERIAQMGRERQMLSDQGSEAPLDPDLRRLRTFYGGYWIAVLLVLLAILFLAGIDIVGILRYRRRHLADIAAARREMIAEQVALLRSQRNGHAD